MEIKITAKHIKCSVEIHDDSNIHEAIDAVCGLLVSYGYHANTVENGILSKAEELEQEEENEEGTNQGARQFVE